MTPDATISRFLFRTRLVRFWQREVELRLLLNFPGRVVIDNDGAWSNCRHWPMLRVVDYRFWLN